MIKSRSQHYVLHLLLTLRLSLIFEAATRIEIVRSRLHFITLTLRPRRPSCCIRAFLMRKLFIVPTVALWQLDQLRRDIEMIETVKPLRHRAPPPRARDTAH